MKVLPKPPGMTESERKKENRRRIRERERDGVKERERERNLMEYSENGTWRLKGFLRATHSSNKLQIYSEIESILKCG